jgi:Site-specific DNA methylase
MTIDAACAYPYSYNNDAEFVEKNVEDVTSEEIAGWYSGELPRLLAGCAPCQPFSSYNNGRDTRNDRKWPLLYAFARLIREVQPELVTMENVPDVTKHEVYHDFVQELRDQKYKVWAERVDCVKYGLPQARRRHVLLASKLGPICIIPETHADRPRTVQQTIGRLGELRAGGAHKRDRLHRTQTCPTPISREFEPRYRAVRGEIGPKSCEPNVTVKRAVEPIPASTAA